MEDRPIIYHKRLTILFDDKTFAEVEELKETLGIKRMKTMRACIHLMYNLIEDGISTVELLRLMEKRD